MKVAEKQTRAGTAVGAREFSRQGLQVTRAYTIQKPAAELFQFWRNFENLPRFMTHLQAITVRDSTHSHWKVKAPGNQTVEWDAEIFHEEPNRLIAWRSLPGGDVDHAGSIRFTETPDRGTEVHVVLDYIPPAGRIGVMIAKLFGEEPAAQVREDLRHFKQLMEAGEIATSEGPRGTCKGGPHGNAHGNSHKVRK